MSDDGRSKVGVFGVGVVALGAVCMRFADDCARVGVSGASLVDDGARGLGRAAALADDGVHGLGRAARVTDDAVLGGRIAQPSIYGPPVGVTDDGARLLEVSRGGETVASPSSLEVGKVALDVTLDVAPNLVGDSRRATGTPPVRPLLAAVTDHPMLLSLLPASRRAYSYVYDEAPATKAIEALIDASGTLPAPGSSETGFLHTFLAGQVDRDPLALAVYAADEVDVTGSLVLVLPDGERIEDARVHHACLRHGDSCVLLVCSPESPGQQGTCMRAARQIWDTAVAAQPDGGEPVSALLGRLFDAREATPEARDIVVSRLAPGDKKSTLHVVRSKLREH